MLSKSRAFSGFSVDNIAAARTFYSEVLGLAVTEENGMLQLVIESGNPILVYPKADHEPATFTILNFPVENIDVAVDGLKERGVEFEMYEMVDEHGIIRGYGPPIAWFTDPAGNVLSVIQVD